MKLMRSFLPLLVAVLSWAVCLQCGLAFQHSTSTTSNKLLWRHINKSTERKVQPTDDAARVSLMALEASMDGSSKLPPSADKDDMVIPSPKPPRTKRKPTPPRTKRKPTDDMVIPFPKDDMVIPSPKDDMVIPFPKRLRSTGGKDDMVIPFPKDGRPVPDDKPSRSTKAIWIPTGYSRGIFQPSKKFKDWVVKYDKVESRIEEVTFPLCKDLAYEFDAKAISDKDLPYVREIAPFSEQGHIVPQVLLGDKRWNAWYNIFPQSKALNHAPSVWTDIEWLVDKRSMKNCLKTNGKMSAGAPPFLATVTFNYLNPLRPQYPTTIEYYIKSNKEKRRIIGSLRKKSEASRLETLEKGVVDNELWFSMNNPFPPNEYDEEIFRAQEIVGSLEPSSEKFFELKKLMARWRKMK